MSEYDWEDDYEEDAPRSQNGLEQARAAYKAQKKQNKELLERLEKAEAALRDRSVKDAIKAKGLNEKVASLIPKDLTTSEEVEAWVDNYADIFGVPSPEQPADPAQQETPAPNPEFDALARIADTQAGGQPFAGDAAQIAALIAAAQTPQELNKILFGNAAGPAAS